MELFGYIRVSTEEQAERGNSILEQKQTLQSFADSMGWKITFFIDEGISAKDMKRPQLQLMLKEVEKKGKSVIVKGIAGIVVTTKLDRLSRKLSDILYLVELFQDNGFTYMSKSENIETNSSGGRMFMQMLGSMAEFERERTAERVRENMTSMARNTKKAITRACYGYDIIDGEYVINHDQSNWVVTMFEWALEGDGPTKIASKLNAMGIPSPAAGDWNQKTVKELMARDTLTGAFIYNKTKRIGTKTIKRDESEWIVNKNHHEGIISVDIFEKVKAMREARKTISRRASEDTYLLSGLVRCGHCGSTMPGKMERSGSRKKGIPGNHVYYRYQCDGYTKKGICSRRTINRDELERLIIKRINDVPKMNLKDITLALVDQETKEVDVSDIELQLEKVNLRMQKQLRAYEDDLISGDDLKIASEQAKKERKQLQQLLETAKKDSEENQKIVFIKRVNSLLEAINSDNRILSKQSIRQVIKQITVTDEGITIDLYNSVL